MSKHWSTFEHTADVGIAAKGDSLAELLEALADGVAELICRRALVQPQDSREIHVTSEDVEALAVDFLSEIANMMQLDRFVIAGVRVDQATMTAVRAHIVGEPYEPARHQIEREVKAVTYHQLRVAHSDGKWVARIIVDL